MDKNNNDGGAAQHPDVPNSQPSGLAAEKRPPRTLKAPVFAQPEPTADPTVFRVNHPSDGPAYKVIDKLNAEHKIFPLPFPAPRGGVEPVLSLLQVFGNNARAIETITGFGQIVFHATGDCGSTTGPATENRVADKMVGDFDEADDSQVPQFNLLLGDVVYSFGEAQYYYDQFYDPYRNYPAPILAAAGNHDGVLSPLAHETSLAAFLRNFCADSFTISADAGGLSRTSQIQPGVFFTFEAPFLRILVLYSNTLEDPGVISDPTIGTSQLEFLSAALARVKAENFQGALLIADHHPPYVAGGQHGSSAAMLAQIDQACAAAGVWPHAFLSGHAHNYQRFTRTRIADGSQIPYIVCGNGGHNVVALTKPGAKPLRTPQVLIAASEGQDQVDFENYDDQNYGYLRIIATAKQLRIEYHPASDGTAAKTPDDAVTVDLASRKLVRFTPSDLGRPALAAMVAALPRG